MKLIKIRHSWPENPPFLIDRPDGCPEYVLLHFITPVVLLYGGQKRKIPAGGCIVFSPGHPQWFYSDSHVLHDWMHLTGEISEMMAKVGLLPDTLYTPQESLVLTKLTAELESEFFANRPCKQTLIETKLQEWFICLSRGIQRDGNSDLHNSRIDELSQFRIRMFSNLEQSWTIAQMADCVHLSESRFYAVYKKVFGISPYRDLLLARMEKARYLLSDSHDTNAQIAAAIGYRNEFDFIRHFKKATGLSPQAFAKRTR